MHDAAGPPSLEEAAQSILSEVPAASSDPWPALRFEPIEPLAIATRCAAIDGGSTVVLDARSVGVYCVRAGYTLRNPNDDHLDRITNRVARTTHRKSYASLWEEMRRLYAWGVDVPSAPMDTTRLVPQLAEAERILSEHDAARRALQTLRDGDVLLLDGSLDDEERYVPLRESLLDRAAEIGVAVAAVSKDSSLTLGGVLPMTLELEELAVHRCVAAPWWADATQALGVEDRDYRVLALQLDERAPVYRVDVQARDLRRLVGTLGALCNDAAYAGYPYMLARIHQRVHYESGEALDLRRDLESIVARRRGHRLSHRLFSRGRDVLELAQ